MNKYISTFMTIVAGMLFSMSAMAYDGSRLWLPAAVDGRHDVSVKLEAKGESASIAAQELRDHWRGGDVVLREKRDKSLGKEGYRIVPGDANVTVTANSGIGLLYGAYHLLRLQSTGATPDTTIVETPAFDMRVLNHWDNLDGTIERGYAGRSLWKWDELPDVISPRYKEYARANASVGINGVVLNNVNASSRILSREYLEKVRVLADIFRPYGIKVYLSANFAAPMQLDSLPTADPLDKDVIKWWKRKCEEIYGLIPDFGGFLVKANSEGQPGPCDFGRSHAEGANMMARALRPHGGKVMWRAFVYSANDADRAKQAYLEFNPLDGMFDDNVIVQIKNGPIDFQPREPFSPLFGAMPSTPQMAELQITQEYLGHANHLAYLAPMWEEFFGWVKPESLKAIAGVANVGDDDNWTGHPMAQANWYAFGRLAWNPMLTSKAIAQEWLPMTVYETAEIPAGVKEGLEEMMLVSREAVVDYMMPLGLHHLFAFGHHYGPEPWCNPEGASPSWLPSYYHRADSAGIGFNRSPAGSDAVAQYPEPYRTQYASASTCPDELLLWFHHLPWDYKMKSGATLWDELCRHYEHGCNKVSDMQKAWYAAAPYLDSSLYKDVERRLATQARDAQWWKDGCLLYFGEFSGMPLPDDVTAPVHTLESLRGIDLGITNYESPSAELLDSKR
ncbi:alpha-glucuronidase [Barnesiella sp. WM24]|uniref:glycoside hydrolase family 20 zincin-like fold domain-containing protein n=1 Tax=Barnesiella sp. WM24 TaxID=2558278 RepID=UPI0010716406|nr:alpha-glucuronidase [Barnesiella sp. WM24]